LADRNAAILAGENQEMIDTDRAADARYINQTYAN
jgi:hypothetical protein